MIVPGSVEARIMPRPATIAMLACLTAPCCTPSTFAWQEDPAHLANYHRAFAAAAGERFVARTTTAALVSATRELRVLWLGDHHESRALHRCQRDLLAQLWREPRPLTLVLEALGQQDDAVVAEHLAGRLDERELRDLVRRRWPQSWLDDPALDCEHWRTLLAMAREHGTPVHGLEPTPRLPLAERDAAIAARVRNLADRAPDHLVVVIVGQAHLCGQGDVAARCGLPAILVGGEPPPALLAATPVPTPADAMLRSDGGLFWFGALLGAPR